MHDVHAVDVTTLGLRRSKGCAGEEGGSWRAAKTVDGGILSGAESTYSATCQLVVEAHNVVGPVGTDWHSDDYTLKGTEHVQIALEPLNHSSGSSNRRWYDTYRHIDTAMLPHLYKL